MTSPQFSKRPCRPRDLLQAAGRQHPTAWADSERLRTSRGAHGAYDWPDWCYLPFAGWAAITSRGRAPDLESTEAAAVLTAVGTWRLTQGVYRFDAELYQSLVETPIEGDIPSDVLYRLPEWCVYIETPELVRDDAGLHHYAQDVTTPNAPTPDAIHGFFAQLDYDVADHSTELRLTLDAQARPYTISLSIGNWSLLESVNKFLKSALRNALDAGIPVTPINHEDRTMIVETVKPLLPLLLYLCSQNAEIGTSADRPSNPVPKRTKRGWRLFPAERVTTWDVGVRLGAALRRAYHAAETAGEGTHAAPRGHIRRAHWHGFRSGPMKTPTGDAIPATARRFDLRWLPPIPVNLDTPDDLPATIRPVKP